MTMRNSSRRHIASLVNGLVLLLFAPLVIASSSLRNIDDMNNRHLIVGGQDADPERYPYYARIDYGRSFGCGGTLVAKDFVLTAAHCALPEDQSVMTVNVGATAQTNDESTIRRQVKRLYQHPTFQDGYIRFNDIALLKIEPIQDSVTMVTMNNDRSIPQAGESITTIGLGLTAENGRDATVLQEVELKIMDDAKCDKLYYGDIHRKSMICAKDPNQDSCHGDSGGPLLLLGETPEEDIQVGVVSFGDICAHETIPGVYSDVAYVQEWIDNILCEQSVDPPSDCRNSSTIILDGDDCRDYPGAFYVSWWTQFQRCEWLQEGYRLEDNCKPENEAWIHCPFTCHSCTYQADDDVSYIDVGTRHNESSSQIPMIMVFVLSGLIVVALFWVGFMRFRRRRREKQLNQTVDIGVPVSNNNEQLQEEGDATTTIAWDE